MAGLTYATQNTMLHHWLIENRSFYQAVKSDPVLSMFYKTFMKHGGIGQTDLVKLHMGNDHQTTAMAEGGSFQTDTYAGAPDVVDSSTIANKLLTSRLSMTGTQKRALEKAFDKVTGESLTDATKEFVDGFKSNLLRAVVGDGSGMLCYAYNASSSVTVYLKDASNVTLDAGHWVWNFLYPGMYLDFITLSTGEDITTNGALNLVTAVTPTSGTITVTSAVDCSTAATFAIRNWTTLSTAGTSGTTALHVEPDGIRGMVYSGNTHATGATVSYLGKSAATYPRWTSLPITAGTNESLNVKMLDQAIFRVQSTPDYILCDPAVISQFRYEAQSMKKMDVMDDASYGHKRSIYMSDKGPVVILAPYYLYGTGRCYVLDSKSFKTKGTLFEPQMIRGKLTVSETADMWFDDAISEFQNICVQRNANTYITGLTTVW